MELKEFFKRPRPQPTKDGVFIVSSVELVQQGLSYFIEKGIIDTTKWFCDAGCGDGRIVVLTASQFGIPSLGVESDPDIVKKAVDNIEYFHKKEQFKVPANIVMGNFVNKETYIKGKVNFNEIKTFFNYVNNHELLAKKIAEESPPGTILLIYDSEPNPKDFSGLKFLETKKVPIGWEISADYYFHVYENI
tara:strand:+ start:227 stop:799 length:573 start_codon:yes stop_codon:yes gene_type:complete